MRRKKFYDALMRRWNIRTSGLFRENKIPKTLKPILNFYILKIVYLSKYYEASIYRIYYLNLFKSTNKFFTSLSLYQ